MNKPYISIIIPVYNSQRFILECLHSIRQQSYQNFEVILVNDGSTDNSAKLIDEFINSHQLSNFYLYTKENGGVSSARNLGLKMATGERIAFVDSDDWIEPNYLLNFVNAINKADADLYLAGFQAYEMETQRHDPWSEYPLAFGNIPQDLYALSSFDYVWGRLYKKSLIDLYAIHFNEKIYYCEDNAFNFDYIRVCKNFACISEIGYTYRRGHEGALSKTIVYPQMRVHFAAHMRNFCNSFSEADIIHTLNNNTSFSLVMWNVLTTEVIVDILNRNFKEAKLKQRTSLAQAIVNAYRPRSKKHRVFLSLWKKSFPALAVMVSVYYALFPLLKKSKHLFYYISHN